MLPHTVTCATTYTLVIPVKHCSAFSLMDCFTSYTRT